jgi:hypothetical protein
MAKPAPLEPVLRFCFRAIVCRLPSPASVVQAEFREIEENDKKRTSTIPMKELD